MITAIFRKGGNVEFVGKELQAIQSLNDSSFKEGRHYPSLVAYIGHILEKHITGTEDEPATPKAVALDPDTRRMINFDHKAIGDQCPKCFNLSLVRKEGCKVCIKCDFTTCG